MNRELEIRERVAHYGLELDGHDRGAWDRARNDLEIHAYSDLRHLLNETARLTAALADMTAERDARIGAVLTPIYTCGGHGYEDDNDEDFWCPVCHAHIGTHRGFAVECPRCKQTINGDGEPIYHYRDMLRSEEEWRGPDAQGGDMPK